MTEDCPKFQGPKDLKDILELLYNLHNSSAKEAEKAVCKNFLQDVKTYCRDDYLTNFYNSSGSSGFLPSVVEAAYEVHKKITSKVNNSPYRHIKATDTVCISKSVQALKVNLPKAFSALYYLYFMTSQDCSAIGGATWNSFKVRDTEGSYYLGQWITGMPTVRMEGLIKGGYQPGDLHKSNGGRDIAEELKKAVSIQPSSNDGSLQNALCGLLFACEWEYALTGHACLFLYKFCEKVMEDQSRNVLRGILNGEPSNIKFDVLSSVCTELQERLLPFTDRGAGSSYLNAVCQGDNTSLFDSIWNDAFFVAYCKWLTSSLDNIISALDEMSKKCPTWGTTALNWAADAGPFRYGFVFMNQKWQNELTQGRSSTLQAQITELTASLQSLLNCLKGDSSPTSERITTEPAKSSPGLTAAGASVGVISLGGAGAGVAYGFNLFGLKDIMSGVFGAIRGLVVGF
ncbi:hypothetical protein X943_000071 [Babesia divergens]|uniref:Uncharacterized protein n=1 Tax=Babesia divergens TaxID=32595 RepID=A0AAD9GCI4_BABDI|nr:hypothetical protein X943_000071 [Babesia divergens]